MRKIRLLMAVYKDPHWELVSHKRLFVSSERELRDRLGQSLAGRGEHVEISKMASQIWDQGFASAQSGHLAVYAHRLAPDYLPVSMTAAPLSEPRTFIFPRFQRLRVMRPKLALASALVVATLLISVIQPVSRNENQLALAACPGTEPDYVAYVNNSMTAEEWEAAKDNSWSDKEKFGRNHYRNHGAEEGRQMWCVQDA